MCYICRDGSLATPSPFMAEGDAVYEEGNPFAAAQEHSVGTVAGSSASGADYEYNTPTVLTSGVSSPSYAAEMRRPASCVISMPKLAFTRPCVCVVLLVQAHVSTLFCTLRVSWQLTAGVICVVQSRTDSFVQIRRRSYTRY